MAAGSDGARRMAVRGQVSISQMLCEEAAAALMLEFSVTQDKKEASSSVEPNQGSLTL